MCWRFLLCSVTPSAFRAFRGGVNQRACAFKGEKGETGDLDQSKVIYVPTLDITDIPHCSKNVNALKALLAH